MGILGFRNALGYTSDNCNKNWKVAEAWEYAFLAFVVEDIKDLKERSI